MLKRKTIGALMGLGAVAALAGAYSYAQSGSSRAPRLDTATIDRGRVISKVTASGSLSATVTVQVGSQVSGRVQDIRVDYNSTVHKGDLLAKIDPQLFEAADAQAKANFAAAQGNLTKSQVQTVESDQQYRRAQELFDQQLIATADLDTARTTAEAARAQVVASKGAVEQARAALHQAEVNLAYTDIFSPTDGVVISRNVDVGQTVAASLQAPTLFVIAADLRKMQVDTSVAEADIGRLRDGMDASFTVDAYPGQTFRGTVRQVRNAPQTVQNVVTYDAVIDVDNAALKLKPGMTANVMLVAAERDDVLRVPNAALRFRPSEDVAAALGITAPTPAPRERRGGREEASSRRRVFALDASGKLRAVPVTIGVSDGRLTEVADGALAAGDRVVVDASMPGATTTAANALPGVPRRVF